MTDFINNFDNKKPADFDERLDAVLAKYAAVEPRNGLEERILANLRAHERTTVRIFWWRWAGALAAVFAVTLLLVWKMERRSAEQIVRHSPNVQQQTPPQTAHDARNDTEQLVVRNASLRWPKRRASTPLALAASGPKLDQFPSPEPLTEQEKMLLDYVGRFHEEAVLIARTRAEELERDRAEEEAEKP